MTATYTFRADRKHEWSLGFNWFDEIVGAAWLDLGWWEVSLELVAGEPEPIDWQTTVQAFTRWAAIALSLELSTESSTLMLFCSRQPNQTWHAR